MTLPERHQADLNELIVQLGEFRIGAAPALEGVMNLLRHAGSGRPFAYGLKRADAGPRLEWVTGTPINIERASAMLNGGKWHLEYDPLRPQATQRNRVITIRQLSKESGTPLDQLRDATTRNVQRAGMGDFAVFDQPRVLVCHRGLLLAWVGTIYSENDPDGFQEQALHALRGPLRRRLYLEDQLQRLALTDAVLPEALEQLGAPALLVDRGGGVVLANAAALQDPRRSPDREQVRAIVRGAISTWEVTAIRSNGLPAMYLLVQRVADLPARSRRHQLSRTWGLTSREAEVLGLLAAGLSNRLISAKLVLSERTVEVHVGRLLNKSGCESRSRLVARILAL